MEGKTEKGGKKVLLSREPTPPKFNPSVDTYTFFCDHTPAAHIHSTTATLLAALTATSETTCLSALNDQYSNSSILRKTPSRVIRVSFRCQR